MWLRFGTHLYFNPRSHERSDGLDVLSASSGNLFQSTLPREERRLAHIGHFSDLNFNPRSHERSDAGASVVAYIIGISIHAPTRGATDFLCGCKQGILFQSTLPREERHQVSNTNSTEGNFNPRSHERSDVCKIFHETINKWISIHAPTRGATCAAAEFVNLANISIHAPTRGATEAQVVVVDLDKFQSTLPREERRFLIPSSHVSVIFQSTLPREERPR